MMNIPAKNETTVQKYPCLYPMLALNESLALTNISIIETYIITPAEKPKEIVSNLGLNFLESKPIRLPIPVDNPAKRVSENANKIELSI